MAKLNQKLGKAKQLLAIGAFVVLVMSSLRSGDAFAETDVAITIAKAANFVYSSDFIHDPVERTFSAEELRILRASPAALSLMIKNALSLQHSVGGAMLTAYFGLNENLDFLRYRLLEPGRTYGWEGTYPNDEERYYSDRQYVYHSVYVRSLEELTDLPLQQVVVLTDDEKERIQRIAASPGHESQHWAIWISRKLKF